MNALLRWWRRPRALRRQLARTLVLVALVSIAIVGGLNLFASRTLLDDGTKESLTGIGESRARSIETGTERLFSQVSAIAADLAVVQALDAFNEGYEQLEDESLTAAQIEALDDFYRDTVLAGIDELGLDPIGLDEMEPATNAGRYLQYHYTLEVIGGDAEARELDDPGDGSAYSESHARANEYLTGLADTFGFSDLLLVSSDGKVVYTAEKSIDLGTDLATGPYRDSELAAAVLEGLTRVRVGEAVLADYQLYLPAAGRPALFAAAAVRSESEIIGAMVARLPIAALNAITAANGRWEEVGLQGGESYVVGPDLLLRSESRPWIEDPDGFLAASDSERTDLIAAFGSPVGLQIVDTPPARAALAGDTFEGTSRNYLGDRTYSYATPVDVAGVSWVAVVDVPLSDARSPLFTFAWRLGLVVLIVLPLAAIVGISLANRLTRPIKPVVDAAAAIAAGERHPDLPTGGRDEFGDLARRLSTMATTLGNEEAAIAAEYQRTREMLLTALPPRLVDAEGCPVGTGEAVDTATVVAVWIEIGEVEVSDDESVLELLTVAGELAETMVAERLMERIRVSADHYLFLAGVNSEVDGADVALQFAMDFATEIGAIAVREDVPVRLLMGLSTGRVATGMLERGSLTFAVWGEPVRRALTIGALTKGERIFVDVSTVDAASDRWNFEDSAEPIEYDGRSTELHMLAIDGLPAST